MFFFSEIRAFYSEELSLTGGCSVVLFNTKPLSDRIAFVKINQQTKLRHAQVVSILTELCLLPPQTQPTRQKFQPLIYENG